MHTNNYEQPVWSKTRKFFFCFIFLYALLYMFPFPINLLVSIIQRFFSWINELTGWAFLKTINDAIDIFFGWWTDLWHWLIPTIAKNVLHLKNPITTFSNGSGDTTYDSLLTLVNIILCLVGAVIWAIRGKAKANYTRLYHLLLLLLRYFVAYIMLSYGFAKVIQSQFPYPYLARLIEPYGESSPMGLAWTFMGYSYGYNLFTGSCEIIGGLLLCFRRTKTFGALFTMTVCITIFIMNMCFDIPVKLFSFHLLFFATYIAADDFKRLVAFFFTNKPVAPHETPYYFAAHKWAKKLVWAKWIIMLFLVYTNYADTKKGYNEYGDGAIKPPLYGIYNAEYKVVNNDTVPLIYKDTTNWKQMIIGGKWPIEG